MASKLQRLLGEQLEAGDKPEGVEVLVSEHDRRVFRANHYYVEKLPDARDGASRCQLVVARSTPREIPQPVARFPEWCLVGFLTAEEMRDETDIQPDPEKPLPKSVLGREQLLTAPQEVLAHG